MPESFKGNNRKLISIVEDHDRPAVVMHVLVVQPVHRQEQRFGDEREPAEIDYLLEFRIDAA